MDNILNPLISSKGCGHGCITMIFSSYLVDLYDVNKQHESGVWRLAIYVTGFILFLYFEHMSPEFETRHVGTLTGFHQLCAYFKLSARFWLWHFTGRFKIILVLFRYRYFSNIFNSYYQHIMIYGYVARIWKYLSLFEKWEYQVSIIFIIKITKKEHKNPGHAVALQKDYNRQTGWTYKDKQHQNYHKIKYCTMYV